MKQFIPILLCLTILIFLSFNSYGSLAPLDEIFKAPHISTTVSFNEPYDDEEQDDSIDINTEEENYESEWPD